MFYSVRIDKDRDRELLRIRIEDMAFSFWAAMPPSLFVSLLHRLVGMCFRSDRRQLIEEQTAAEKPGQLKK